MLPLTLIYRQRSPGACPAMSPSTGPPPQRRSDPMGRVSNMVKRIESKKQKRSEIKRNKKKGIKRRGLDVDDDTVKNPCGSHEVN